MIIYLLIYVSTGANAVDLIRSLVDVFKCLMESDLCNKHNLPVCASKCSCEYARMYSLL